MTTSPLLGTVDRAAGAVHLERTLPAPVHEVWDALTDPARLHAWLAPVQQGQPGPESTFVLGMNDRETATCTVTTWTHRTSSAWYGTTPTRVPRNCACGYPSSTARRRSPLSTSGSRPMPCSTAPGGTYTSITSAPI